MLDEWTGRCFDGDRALVFIGAVGIAVRAIAPYVQAKTSDPAVIVIDESARFVIPLLSGHIGGANRLALDIAKMLGATPVITTATDSRGVFAIDDWASQNNIRIISPERIKGVSARLLAGEEVRIKSVFPVEGRLPKGLIPTDDECDVIVTIQTRGYQDALRLAPPVLTLGIGCRRGAAVRDIECAFTAVLEKAGCHQEAVCGVCSIDLKVREAGILAFCAARGLPFQTFSAQELREVKGDFASSELVQEIAGVDNVCERSAVLGSGGELLVGKQTGNGVAVALAVRPYTVRFGEEE
jgi:cobalt-precorrin 5A hydrolase